MRRVEMDFYKHGVGNKQGGWKTKMDFDKRGGWKIFMKSINVEGGFFFEEGGIFQNR
jgi:hypothetical protein